MAKINTSAELHHAIGETPYTKETIEIVEALLALTRHLELLTKAVLELEGEQCDGKPCLTIGTRLELERWRDG